MTLQTTTTAPDDFWTSRLRCCSSPPKADVTHVVCALSTRWIWKPDTYATSHLRIVAEDQGSELRSTLGELEAAHHKAVHSRAPIVSENKWRLSSCRRRNDRPGTTFRPSYLEAVMTRGGGSLCGARARGEVVHYTPGRQHSRLELHSSQLS